ncbi:hypothetical protein B484DRAFT_426267 [Ochromonadaceae sp. CCMP2298]|nr:hypothetical protein B484DRAFT_426267 [Ochromonadaceae sp. CCMP2298]
MSLLPSTPLYSSSHSQLVISHKHYVPSHMRSFSTHHQCCYMLTLCYSYTVHTILISTVSYTINMVIISILTISSLHLHYPYHHSYTVCLCFA